METFTRTLVALLLTILRPQLALSEQPQAAVPDSAAIVSLLEKTLVRVIAQAEPSVVAISRLSGPQSATASGRSNDVFVDLRDNTPTPPTPVGAGVIIDRTGLVLTHYLAVHEGDQHIVTTIHRQAFPATIRAADPRSGLAILAIDAKNKIARPAIAPAKPVKDDFPALKLGDGGSARKGQFVIAIGNPYAIQTDGQPTASWGIITNLARKAPAGTNFNDAPGPAGDYRTTLHHLGTLIQTDAKLGFSAAGGALVSLNGELIGLTTTAATIAGHEQPAGYAIPINATTGRIIDTLKQGREVEYGMLGVAFEQVSQSQESLVPQLKLSQVFEGGPAASAGLAPGDLIVRTADEPVSDVDSLQLAISKLPPAAVTSIEYTRGGQKATAKVTLGKLAVLGKKMASVRLPAWQGIRVDYSMALEAAELAQAFSSGAIDPSGCVLVADVEPDSAAWKTGMRRGMFISHVGGRRVTSPAEFAAAAASLGSNFDIQLTQTAAAPGVRKTMPPTK